MRIGVMLPFKYENQNPSYHVIQFIFPLNQGIKDVTIVFRLIFLLKLLLVNKGGKNGCETMRIYLTLSCYFVNMRAQKVLS